MFLKRIEIVGFKSFAERVTIDFDRGVTAVVGPNGSGKSNITDAIRWVLGEQSAKSLRGGKMEDIIFAGSDSRKPLNFAEVALTLDNEDHFLPLDYNEICITRRVYRSGESEFFINKQSCRLKDIVDLLMDSGLGRDAFSIISQGRVEEILNSKPEERRTIFEEAAGVLRYKNRKKKAEVKLYETEENLYRVKDILHELESQLEPLQIQASVAKDYLEKKEELENYEVGLIVYEIEDLHEKWEQLKEELQKHKDLELKFTTQIQAKEAELTKTRDQIAALDESIDQLQEVLLITTKELEKLEGKKEVIKERKKNAGEQIEFLKTQINVGTQRLKGITDEKERLETEYKSLKQKLTQKQEELRNKENELNSYAEGIEERIESLKADYIEQLNRLATIKNEQQHLTQQIERISLRRKQLLENNKKFIEERDEILSRKQDVSKKYQEIEQQLNQEIQTILTEQRELEKLKSQYAKDEKTYYKALQYIQQVKSRIDILEEMEEDYTGFYQGVKEILKNRKQLQGIEGAVAELIQVDQPYEKAMEIALSSSMQHIVVQTDENARKAIQYLKQRNLGRATFLPLSTIKRKDIPPSFLRVIQDHPAFIGIGANLLKYDQKYDDIIYYLLGNVLIVKDLVGANEIAKMIQHRYRIVTLDGDIVNPGGSMTGGSMKQKTSSLLTRKTELDQLKVKLEEIKEKTNQLEANVKRIKQSIEDKEEIIVSKRTLQSELQEKLQKIKDQLKDITWEESNINEKLALYDREESGYLDEESSLQAKKVDNENIIKQLENLIANINAEIKELTEKQSQDQFLKESLSNDISELKIEIAKITEQYRHAKAQLDDIITRWQETKTNLENNQENYENYQEALNMSDEDEIELIQLSESKLVEKNQTIELISARRQQRLEFQQKLEQLELEEKELKRQHKGISEQVKDEEVKLNRLDVELENRLTILYTDYSLTFEGAKEKYKLALPYDESKKKVKLIKRAIEELGVVNLGAIDEFERISERYKFLVEQRDDLENAKETLYQVIDEMDEEMVKRFSETFFAISEQFEDVFQSLFGGGKAELKLTDPDDLLNTGIEIVAQPPGKKLQTLALLSGGERALTAIALLFSILRVRPVPFCVLDEVEAALDEANVFRFSQYLRKFSEETQFIVITHRKGTMEEADVLYGVTMQESGVSKLVSVRLEESLDHVNV